MARYKTTFFHLLSCIVNENNVDWSLFSQFTPRDWDYFYVLSKQQGVVAVVFEKIKDIPKEVAPPKAVTLKWFSNAISIEEQMRAKERIAIDFANCLSERNIPIVVLKGLAYASYYPNPYHREYGDLDCYLLGEKDAGDRATIDFGGTMEEAGYKHSHLCYKGLTIENHRYLTSFAGSKRGIKAERLLQMLIKENYTPIGGTKLLIPSADFSALFLIKHAQRHFIMEGIRLRHLLDWAFFLKSESSKVNWERIIPLMQECGILEFAKVITTLCIEKFGMHIDTCAIRSDQSQIAEALLTDIWGDQPDPYNENLIQKSRRIMRRFYRMWKFRSIADDNYLRLVWKNIAFSSYLNRDPKL